MFKNYVQWKISAFTGGKTEIKDASVGFTGIILQEIKISFADKSEINVEKITVSPNLFPFPRKQIAFNEINIINPAAVFKTKLKDFNFLKRAAKSRHPVILSRLVVKNGGIIFPGKELKNINLDIRSASLSSSFPIDLIFDISDTNVYIQANFNYKENKITLDKVIIRETEKIVYISGVIKDFSDFKDVNFDFNVNGSGILFNKVFLSNLYDRKIAVFDKGEINLNISGNQENFRIDNRR